MSLHEIDFSCINSYCIKNSFTTEIYKTISLTDTNWSINRYYWLWTLVIYVNVCKCLPPLEFVSSAPGVDCAVVPININKITHRYDIFKYIRHFKNIWFLCFHNLLYLTFKLFSPSTFIVPGSETRAVVWGTW